ncbi:MAG: radical SAM protein [Bacteroidales bacterium]|nr:radical SAM protein [Bacteroidales bacterium]
METALYESIIFGPIHSRRLGISLGINLLPAEGKICSFNCIYCECGYNEERKGGKFPSREDVYKALEAKLVLLKQQGIEPNVFTFAGNGEPTLNPHFPQVIDDTIILRDKYFPNAKISVLSNSTQILKDSVFNALKKVDNNILKIDSAFIDTIKLIDDPNQPDYNIDRIVDRMAQFKGEVIVQTMILRGEHNGKVVDNSTDEQINALIKLYKLIAPKQVMIYSLDRPTPEDKLIKVEKPELQKIADRINAEGIFTTVS